MRHICWGGMFDMRWVSIILGNDNRGACLWGISKEACFLFKQKIFPMKYFQFSTSTDLWEVLWMIYIPSTAVYRYFPFIVFKSLETKVRRFLKFCIWLFHRGLPDLYFNFKYKVESLVVSPRTPPDLSFSSKTLRYKV